MAQAEADGLRDGLLACHRYSAGECRSCSWLPLPQAQQLQAKQTQLRELLAELPGADSCEQRAPVGSALAGFRNKAKMAVGGRAGALSLGLHQLGQAPVDLCDCPLYPPSLQQALRQLRDWLDELAIPPYDIARRRGELKHVLLTQALPAASLQLRLVLRSRSWLHRLAAALPALQQRLPQLAVASVNLQPLPAAVLEGEEEVLLGTERWLEIPIGPLRLRFGVQSFLQTNPGVAAMLYAEAGRWVSELAPRLVWDLYCGIGGFAFSAALGGARVIGIERSAEAITAARESLQAGAGAADGEALRQRVGFRVGDLSTVESLPQAADEAQPELVIVNPPRRGLGEALCRFLLSSGCRHLLYSSCHPPSLKRDLLALPGFRLRRWQLFDMFPHTPHAETLVLLTRH